MKVKCIDNDKQNGFLTLNKVYEVISSNVSTNGIKFYSIETDNGIITEYFQDRFEIVEEENGENKYEELAKNIGRLVDAKNKQYGDAINETGEFLKILFPEGIKPEQYNELGVIVRVFDKMKRIANGNKGSENSWNDIAGYGILMSSKDDF